MTVTNLVWLTSVSETFTEENKAAMASALDGQADFVARHIPSAPTDREARGVALFQQVEDPRVAIETAHWSSSDEHSLWLASDEYKAGSAPLGAHFDFSKLEYFHLDNELFRAVVDGEESLLRSPVISVGRIRVSADQRDELSRVWASGSKILEDFAKPHIVRSGFRVQKPDPETDEFVFFVGWPSVEKHGEFAHEPRFAEYADPLRAIAKGFDVKHYRRIL